jgi:P pilus assembly chaperone PapD
MLHTGLVRRSASAALILAALLATPRPAVAVNVSPAVVIIDGRSREGVVTLRNGGEHPEEIELTFQHGTSVADGHGNVRLVLSDSAPSGAQSALGWVRAFPRRLVLAPGETQTVRIMVRPPQDLAAGEYWARLVVSAVPQGAGTEQQHGAATMRLRIGTRIVAAVHYRVGRLATGLGATGATAERDGENVDLTVNLARQGNAAFVGRLRARFIRADGSPVGDEYVEPLTLYAADLRRRFRIPAKAVGAGAVAVEFTFDTDRTDLPAGAVVRAQPTRGRVSITGGAAAAAGKP